MAAIDDYFILDEMKTALRRHLSAALIECAALARDLTLIDADDAMRNVRAEFDADAHDAPVQDCFSNAFGKMTDAVRDAGGEPLAARAKLPSGAIP